MSIPIFRVGSSKGSFAIRGASLTFAPASPRLNGVGVDSIQTMPAMSFLDRLTNLISVLTRQHLTSQTLLHGDADEVPKQTHVAHPRPVHQGLTL